MARSSLHDRKPPRLKAEPNLCMALGKDRSSSQANVLPRRKGKEVSYRCPVRKANVFRANRESEFNIEVSIAFHISLRMPYLVAQSWEFNLAVHPSDLKRSVS